MLRCVNCFLNEYMDMDMDMIEVYKILTNKYDSRVNLYLEKQQDSTNRGYSLKLVNTRWPWLQNHQDGSAILRLQNHQQYSMVYEAYNTL